MPDPSSYSAIGWVIVVIAAICAGANQFLKLLDRAKGRRPEPPNELLHLARLELERRMEVAEQLLNKLQEAGSNMLERLRLERQEDLHTIDETIDEVRRDLSGMVETNRKDLTTQTETIRRELVAAHEATRIDVAKNFKDVERALGRIEGKIKT